MRPGPRELPLAWGAPWDLGADGLELCAGPGCSAVIVVVLEASQVEGAFVSSIASCFVVPDPLV